ncbi:uncharacterized protein [Argopecten irradians]|uniref:uncharacterized protein n=1 Tax=Argopecten irradians TaxID=31199 RepID=UPI00371686E8
MPCINGSAIISQGRRVFNVRNLLFVLLILVTVELVTFNPTKCAMMGSILGLCSVQRMRGDSSKVRQIGWFWETKPEVTLPLCPLIPPTIVGKVPVTTAVYSWEALETKFKDVGNGGRYRPTHCTARHRVAIVLPFRDREIHLKILLNNLHPFLQKQQLDYAIFIVDLMPEVTFNRAMLLNIGFAEALKLYDYQCFIFHDVDLIPEMGHNMYSCPENPRHMSVAIDTMHYRLPYNNIFGGVVAMTKEQFQQVNGFSNKYFGWGGEDDDMFNRIRTNNMSITRYPGDVSRYKMLSHKKEHGNPDRFHLLQGSKKRWQKDGLNSLKYSRVKLELRKLYTYLLVDVDEVYIMSNGEFNRSHHKQHQHQLQQQFQEQNIDQRHIAKIQQDIQKGLQFEQQKQRIEQREKQKQQSQQKQQDMPQSGKQGQQQANQLNARLNQHVQQNLHENQVIKQTNIQTKQQVLQPGGIPVHLLDPQNQVITNLHMSQQQNPNLQLKQNLQEDQLNKNIPQNKVNQNLQQSQQALQNMQHNQQVPQNIQNLHNNPIQQNLQHNQQVQHNVQQIQQNQQNIKQSQQIQQNVQQIQQNQQNIKQSQQIQQNVQQSQQIQQDIQQNKQVQQNVQQNQLVQQNVQQSQQIQQNIQENKQPQQNTQQKVQLPQNQQQHKIDLDEKHKILQMAQAQSNAGGVIKLPNLLKHPDVHV